MTTTATTTMTTKTMTTKTLHAITRPRLCKAKAAVKSCPPFVITTTYHHITFVRNY